MSDDYKINFRNGPTLGPTHTAAGSDHQDETPFGFVVCPSGADDCNAPTT